MCIRDRPMVAFGSSLDHSTSCATLRTSLCRSLDSLNPIPNEDWMDESESGMPNAFAGNV